METISWSPKQAEAFVIEITSPLGAPTILPDDILYHTRQWRTSTMFGDPGSAAIIVIRKRDKGNTLNEARAIIFPNHPTDQNFFDEALISFDPNTNTTTPTYTVSVRRWGAHEVGALLDDNNPRNVFTTAQQRISGT